MKDYTPIIGLEVHIELSTKSKMFCGCAADYFGKPPNTFTCPVCLGLPGALPVPNKKDVEWSILLGLALGCKINEESKFDRKHYFYPDLPKGFQISQYDQPLCTNGQLLVKTFVTKEKLIRIQRVHIEEDTGKLIHTEVEGKKVALVDLNRCGVPLVEVVSEPDFRTIDEVDQYMKKLQQIVRYLGISSADMEKGTMRIEPSISMAEESILSKGKLPMYKVELKNINSFRFVRKALEYEIQRQTDLLVGGETPIQQTRGWNESKGTTIAQRKKEEAQDYRYFPEPDIPPMRWEKRVVEEIREKLPELPDEKMRRFVSIYSLNEYDADKLCETKERAYFFEECVKLAKEKKLEKVNAKVVANWLINKKINLEKVKLTDLMQEIFESQVVEEIPEEQLKKEIKHILEYNPNAVGDYKNGKKQVFAFLMGLVLKKIGKQASIEKVKQELIKQLS